jgi:hypothetical protein
MSDPYRYIRTGNYAKILGNLQKNGQLSADMPVEAPTGY